MNEKTLFAGITRYLAEKMDALEFEVAEHNSYCRQVLVRVHFKPDAAVVGNYLQSVHLIDFENKTLLGHFNYEHLSNDYFY
jgi:hypothetical protein